MATDPLPEQTEQSVAPAIPQGGGMDAQVSPAETGGALAQGVAAAGRDVEDIGLQMKQRVDEIQSANADTAFGQEVAKQLWDPQTGVVATKGPAAAARMADAQNTLNDYRDQIADRLGDNTQRQQFLAQAKSRLFQFEHFGGSHVAEQSAAAGADAFNAQVALARQTGVAVVAHHGAGEVPALQAQLSAINDSVAAYGRSQNWSPEVLAQHQAAAATAYHNDILEAMVKSGQVPEAIGWFQAHSDAMTAEGQNAWAPQIRAAIRTNTIGLRVDAALTGAMPHGAPAGSVPDGDTAAAIIAGDSILKRDPEAMREALTEVRARVQQMSLAQRQADDAAAKPLVTGIVANHGAIDSSTASAIAKLSSQAQAAVRQIAADAANPPPTDYLAYTAIHNAMRSDPAAFAAKTGLEVQGMVAGKLNPVDKKVVVDAWTQLQDHPPGEVFAIDNAVKAAGDMARVDTGTPAGAERMYGVANELRNWSQATAGNLPGPDALLAQARQILVSRNLQSLAASPPQSAVVPVQGSQTPEQSPAIVPNQDRVLTIHDAGEFAMRRIGIDRQFDPDAALAFETALDSRVTAREQATNTRVAPEDIDPMVRQMQAEAVSTPGRWFGRWWYSAPRPVYQLSPDEQKDAVLAPEALQKWDPQGAAEVTANLRDIIRKQGGQPERVEAGNFDHALGQLMVARALKHQGDGAGSMAAMRRMYGYLGIAVPAPGSSSGDGPAGGG